LAQPIPSATQIVDEAEKISGALHQYFLQDATPHARPSAPSNLINSMTNITQQLEEYQPGSDVGPALHAARQVAYWSSVVISMVSNSAATIPSSNLNNPTAFVAHPNVQPASSRLPSSIFQPTSSNLPSSIVQPTLSSFPSLNV